MEAGANLRWLKTQGALQVEILSAEQFSLHSHEAEFTENGSHSIALDYGRYYTCGTKCGIR